MTSRRRVNSTVGPCVMETLITILAITLFAGSPTGHGSGHRPEQCPLASFGCTKVEGAETKYHCFTATTDVPKHPPQFQWRVSAGKIIGSRKSDELFIDTRRVKSKTITVTLKVHWKNF